MQSLRSQQFPASSVFSKSWLAVVQIFVEYVMLSRVNDNPEQAHELGKLVSHRVNQYMINLIPWNPVYSPDIKFEAPGPQRTEEFYDILRSYGLHCTVRREMGQDISGETDFFILDVCAGTIARVRWWTMHFLS